jgi:hypothetical protein
MLLAALRFNRTFRLAAWLALWAMLLPAVLTLVHHPASLGGAAQPICHVALGGDHKQTPAQEKSQPSCPICLGFSLLAQGFVPTDTLTLAVVRPAAERLAEFHRSFVVFDPATAAWPRAPPVLA